MLTILSTNYHCGVILWQINLQLSARHILVQTVIVDMIVIVSGIGYAIRARAKRSGSCVFRTSITVWDLTASYQGSLYWSCWVLQVPHHSETILVSALSHVEQGKMCDDMFVDLLWRIRQTILTLIAFLSNYCVFLKRRGEDRIVADRWCLVFVKVLSPITAINWFFS